ncbi:hypothetical protein BDQ17DRAFT_1368500 [Cyathus striatus]|nr:hypothetical protein BDQ17DRAFT_1379581 [Cyathus striatus]KAF8993295.1 hypothetical protein BDQ17DRAFT_1368500 [Cyathus striatus]
MQFSKLSSVFSLAFLVTVATALPNPKSQADFVICAGTGIKCSTNGYHCCGFIASWQSCLPISTVC